EAEGDGDERGRVGVDDAVADEAGRKRSDVLAEHLPRADGLARLEIDSRAAGAGRQDGLRIARPVAQLERGRHVRESAGDVVAREPDLAADDVALRREVVGRSALDRGDER